MGVIPARSRWRWTIVVVRQFSLVATSENQPPAGIRCGVERTAIRIPSHPALFVEPVFFTRVSLLFVVMACSPGLSLKNPPQRAGGCPRKVRSPWLTVAFSWKWIRRKKRSGDPFLWTWSVNTGTSAWLPRVFPRDPHSDQEVCQGNTYNGKICRVRSLYYAVQQLNRNNGKGINAERILAGEQPGTRILPDLPAGAVSLTALSFFRGIFVPVMV